MKRTLIILFALAGFGSGATAQQASQFTVHGWTVDSATNEVLPGVTAMLWLASDSSETAAGVTDATGHFGLRVFRSGLYRLRLSFVGFETHIRDVAVDSAQHHLGTIPLVSAVLEMGEVLVEGALERIRVEGDTTIFNADAFKVNPDASAQDLVEKMPGIVVQDGQVQAQGEDVQRVTVDGREFFGNDPRAALQNLPADVIQSIEVFDTESEQSQFTGFNDGNQQRTINIVTRTGMSNGQFGKVYGGYGGESRYITGGNANIFDEDRRISIIGLSNNINQQNFAFEDLLGISGRERRGPPGGGIRMRDGGGGRGGGGGGRGGGRTGFNPRNFLVGQQGGLNTTSSAGINYSDEIGSSLQLTASYFFNRMGNSNAAFLDRELFLAQEQSQFYNENTESSSTNYNHRLNARIEYTIDENNSLLIRPNFSVQDNSATSNLSGSNALFTGAMLNSVLNRYASNNVGYTSSTDILYRHRFAKPGRTISANLEIGVNDRSGDTDQYSVTEIFELSAVALDETNDQQIDNKSAGQSYGLEIDYTEQLGERSRIQLSYEPSLSKNVSDRFAYVQDLKTGLYTVLDPTFSSLFDNNVIQQRGGASYQLRIEDRFEIQLGVEAQSERLLGDQTYPVPYDLDRSFFSILPEVEIEFEVGESLDLDLDYRTRTNTPSMSQLQDVIDNTNPLFLSTGNPDLEPSYTHNIRLRARRGNWREGRIVFGFADFNYMRNSIGTASLLAMREMELEQGIILPQGAQFSYPVNLTEPSISARSFFGMGRPVGLLQSNFNFRGGVTYARTPGLINNRVNMGSQYGLNSGLTIASNISENLDFTVSYGANYTIASNSFYQELDEDYFRHDTGVRFAWLPVGGLVLEGNLTYNEYVGLDEELYPTTFIVNAGVGYKFMQLDAAEVKLVVGDIFNQETGISRSITELYIEDSSSQVLGRYVLLNLSYRFRNFGL